MTSIGPSTRTSTDGVAHVDGLERRLVDGLVLRFLVLLLFPVVDQQSSFGVEGLPPRLDGPVDGRLVAGEEVHGRVERVTERSGRREHLPGRSDAVGDPHPPPAGWPTGAGHVGTGVETVRGFSGYLGRQPCHVGRRYRGIRRLGRS